MSPFKTGTRIATFKTGRSGLTRKSVRCKIQENNKKPVRRVLPNGLLSGFRFMIILRQPINTNEDAGARAADHNGDHAGRNAGHNRAAVAAEPDRSAGARNSADAADSGDDSGHNDDDGRYR